MNNEYSMNPEIFVFLVKSEKEWMAYGSRKINYVDIESVINHGDEFSYYGGLIREMSPATLREIKLTGSLTGLTMCVGSTQLGALGTLLDALRREEDEERKQNEAYTKRQEDIARFGGEVNEDLIRKIVKLRKKQAKKTQREKEYDPYDEWDF